MALTLTRSDYAEGIARLAEGLWNHDDLVAALQPSNADEERELFAAADRVRREHMGDGVHLRGLVEFSNFCSRTCHYCGLRGPNTDLARYRMTPTDIIESAVHADSLGYRTVVLQSGEDAWYDADKLAGIVRGIKSACDIAITLCVGERPREDFALWREAGADRYLLRIETSNPELYSRLHPNMSFNNRVRSLHILRELGYQVGSGVLLGLPGQTVGMLANDLAFLAEFQPDMLGFGPFIPHPQTPLAAEAPGNVDMTLRMTALSRLLIPDAYIVATTALGTLDPAGREKGLQAGANVVMPNVTPRQYRALYEIYPNKICIDESAEKCRGCIAARIASIGRRLAADHGHATRPITAEGSAEVVPQGR